MPKFYFLAHSALGDHIAFLVLRQAAWGAIKTSSAVPHTLGDMADWLPGDLPVIALQEVPLVHVSRRPAVDWQRAIMEAYEARVERGRSR